MFGNLFGTVHLFIGKI